MTVQRRVVAARACSTTQSAHVAELERVAVPRLRVLAGVFALFGAILVVVFASLGKGVVDDSSITTRAIAIACGQIVGALAMVGMTYLAWPARHVVVAGVVFQLAASASLAVLEQAGVSLLGAWILNFALVPTTAKRAAVVAFSSAAMVPSAFGLAAALGGRTTPTPVELLHWGMLFVIAAIAVVTARTIYGLECSVESAKQLGAYELVEQLGEGGMGEVWRAEHHALARPAAIKLIRQELTARLDAAERDALNRRFRLEVQATAMLTSPHTVAVYDFGETDDGELYYVMELLHGLDAEHLVARHGPLPAERAIYLVRQACASLGEAHRRALVHRDIKPANLFLCAVGTEVDFVKVLDFGLVHGVERGTRLTAAGSVSGTPAYLAPETIARGVCDARSDIYALGCVAYWLLTGTLVFDHELPGAMMAAHIHDEPARLACRTELAIPPALEAIVLACLAKDPAKRPQTTAVLDAMLAAVDVRPWARSDAESWWRTHVPETLAHAWRDTPARPTVQPTARHRFARGAPIPVRA